ncbi:DUF4062 domain-containing protein [Zooshikella marina]|uniref:DUF4062 domain-containing protein n=1 Tax=Zooshikella ganghwensis TaxID=202772 RepID=UPI001BB00660|nr:DUF4062 domain-containing protein [Zooshikella ganghwensis]MBU2707467.1 DUF4062 domain-containing protein [Zooshikella ganghwensis]
MSLLKRYQIFISSTYRDLVEERQALVNALLCLGCIPVGPEFLPGFRNPDQDNWPHVRRAIDQSDYIVLVSGGRYGSLTRSGISYLHREYTYAHTLRKPILCLVRDLKAPLAANKKEVTAEGVARLRVFRESLQKHNNYSWDTSETLVSLLRQHLPAFIEQTPAPGWIRAADVSEIQTEKQVDLRKQLADLQEVKHALQHLSPSQSNSINALQELVELSFACNIYIEGNCKLITSKATLIWQDVFNAFAIDLDNSASEDKIKESLAQFLAERYTRHIHEAYEDAHAVSSFQFTDTSLRMIRLHLRRMGLIRKDTLHSNRSRAVWQLTPLGRKVLEDLRQHTAVNN